MVNVVDELIWRGLLKDATEGFVDLLSSEKITLYNGFDPTGDSLHIGHLLPLMALARFQRLGHTPIALGGGGTALVGDPSGKSSERPLLSQADIEANLEKIKRQLAHLLDFETKTNTALLLNNFDWLNQLNMLQFLRDVGKYFTVNYMLAKDSVKSRLSRDQGISYTEFSYMLLQSYDFLYLHDQYQCKVQAGGSDQWGNITAGVELIRRVRGVSAQAVSYPLITRSDGTKFGKTASGESVWLDAEKTSPYRFYQFWINADDRDVISYLKFFTWLTKAEVESLEAGVKDEPESRNAQKILAKLMTEMIHGRNGLARAEQATNVLFGGSLEGLTMGEIEDVFSDVPTAELPMNLFSGEGMALADLLSEAGVCASKSEARRIIESGGISINNQRIDDVRATVAASSSLHGKFIVIRRGRKNYHLVRLLQ